MKDKIKQAKNKEYQDKRKAELQAAAVRDGFGNWSQALTAWKNGQARLIHTHAAQLEMKQKRSQK